MRIGTGLGITDLRGGGGSVFQNDLIIVAFGQSSEQSASGSGFAQSILSSDQDASGDIGVWEVNQADPGALDTTGPLQPMTWPANNANLGPARAFKMAQDMKPLVADGKKIIIIPGAVGGQALVSGTLSAPSGTYYVDTTDALTQALAAYPGADVIMSFTQGEQDGNNSRTQSQYETAFIAMAAGFRAIAPGMPIIIHQMQPDRFIDDPSDQPGRIPIDAAHKNLPLIVDNCYFIPAEEGQGIVGDPSHFVGQAHRDAGARAADYYNLPERYTTQAPATPSAPSQVGSTSEITITVTDPPAPAYVIETRAQGSSGAWAAQVVHCPTWVAPGGTFTATATATGDVEMRLKTRSRFGDSAASSAVDMTLSWWHPDAYFQYRPGTGVYVNGTAYADLTAARSAGAVVTNGNSVDQVALPVSYSALTLATKATTNISGPAAVTEYAASLDDTVSTTNSLVFSAYVTNGGTDYMNLAIFSSGSSQMAPIPNAATSFAVSAGGSFRHAVTFSGGTASVSLDGGAVGTDGNVSFPSPTHINIGNREDGARPWLGSEPEILVTLTRVSDADLASLLA